MIEIAVLKGHFFRLLTWCRKSLNAAPILICEAISIEHMIESRSATPKPAGQPRNDTGVITHALAAGVKRWNRNTYHSVTRIRRVGTSACLSHPPCPNASARRRLMFVHVKVTVLVGGVGGARFLIGVQRLLGLARFRGPSSTRQ